MGSLATLLGYSALFLKKGKKTNGGQFVLGHKKKCCFLDCKVLFFFTFVYTQECMLYTIGIVQTG